MTPYSASRGIRYTAPPGPDGSRRDEADVEEPSAAAVEADGGEAPEDGAVPADDD